MAQIKPMPVHIREYYKAMRTAYTQKKEEAIKEREELISEADVLQQELMERHEDYLKYNINLSKYDEFINNEYIDGHFLRMAKGAYLNRENDYELTAELHSLLKLAEMQYKIYELKNDIERYNKILSIKSNEYVRYMREYFNVVHKKMILEGCAYQFGHKIGNVVINRVKYTSKRKGIDYKATKEKKAEIVANGGRLYNKQEAEWCEKNGLEYKAEDGRVYLDTEYYYEVFMFNRCFPDARMFSFTPQDYRSVEIRGKSNKQLIEECGGDLNKICELPIDMKSKLHMCVEVDKMLYTNFIRNENQTSYKYTTPCG